MVKTALLLKKLWINKREYITSAELRENCKTLGLNYDASVHYLLKRKHILRILKGIFYIKSVEEFELGTTKHNHLELVSRGMQLKGVDRWYFGFHTALKLNNMTHEYFTLDEVVNDTISRSNPTKIVGYEFLFYKFRKQLFEFGIIEEKDTGIRYSDPEKTILDFIYLSRFHGISSDRIVDEISDWTSSVSFATLRDYSQHYPKTVTNISVRLTNEL